MKLLTACCVAALFASVTGYAQTTTGSTVVGKMTVTATVVSSDQTTSSTTKQKSDIMNNVLILRSSTGQIQYQMSVSGIQVVNTDGSIDNVTTGEILNSLAAAAVQQGTDLGYTSSGSGTAQTGVWSETDVLRSGSGLNTQFDANSTDSSQTDQIFDVSSDGSVQYVGSYTTSGSEQSVIQ